MGDNRLKNWVQKRAQSSDTHVEGRGIWSKAITTLLSPLISDHPFIFFFRRRTVSWQGAIKNYNRKVKKKKKNRSENK